MEPWIIGLHAAFLILFFIILFVSFLLRKFYISYHEHKRYINLQIVGLCAMLVGTLGMVLFSRFSGEKSFHEFLSSSAHTWIGLVVTLVSLIQPITGGLAIFFLNHFENVNNRECFQSFWYELAHIWMGRMVLILVPINMLIGFIMIQNSMDTVWIVFMYLSFFAGMILAFFVFAYSWWQHSKTKHLAYRHMPDEKEEFSPRKAQSEFKT